VAVSIAFLAASASANAAPGSISGTLSKPGYTVIALAANGKASAALTRRGKFKLRPPARRVTLHLRAPNGKYAGPVMVARGRKGRFAILGVSAGARLGQVSVRRGYAKPTKRLPQKWIDARRVARARNGVPIGARRFGRVRSKPLRRAVPGDLDADGIPAPLDIDDDGDLILDNLDRSPEARAAQAVNQFQLSTGLPAMIFQTVNADAAPVTDQDVDALLSGFGLLLVGIVPGNSVELDCGTLVYCSSGGSGRLFSSASPPDQPFPPFPACCDPDGDGFGTMSPQPPAPGSAIFLQHGATSAQIRTGDVLIERVATGAVETDYTSVIQYVAVTVPALRSYDDGQGNSASLSYPVAPDGPGTNVHPLAVTTGTDGNAGATLTIWRPQRKPIPPEAADWIDIGGLTYEIAVAGVGLCPQDSLSTTDPNLTPSPLPTVDPGVNGGGFRDLATDQTANAANTLTFTVNLTRCLAASGRPFAPGDSRGITINAVPPDLPPSAEQTVFFQRK
jgi:hypothetical protein